MTATINLYRYTLPFLSSSFLLSRFIGLQAVTQLRLISVPHSIPGRAFTLVLSFSPASLAWSFREGFRTINTRQRITQYRATRKRRRRAEMFVRSFVVRPRGQTERGIKRERTLRTATDLVYKDPQPRARRKGAGGKGGRRW